MKFFTIIIFLMLLNTNCSNRITDPGSSDNKITLKTDKLLYHSDDDINVKLSNNSDSTFVIGLVCGEMLQMYYQINEDNGWSDYIDLYMFNCPTFFDSLKSDEIFTQAIPASAFQTPATFRLLINENIISNSFTIN